MQLGVPVSCTHTDNCSCSMQLGLRLVPGLSVQGRLGCARPVSECTSGWAEEQAAAFVVLRVCACAAEAQNGVLRMALQQEVPAYMFTLPRVWEQVWHCLHHSLEVIPHL